MSQSDHTPFIREVDSDPIPDALGVADRMEALNATQNGGRGVQLIRDLVVYLRRGMVEMATGVARYDSDKLWSFPALREMVNRELLNTEWDRKTRKRIWGDEFHDCGLSR